MSQDGVFLFYLDQEWTFDPSKENQGSSQLGIGYVGAQTHILVLSVPLKRLFICCFSLELQS
jgi:hypothetical protein